MSDTGINVLRIRLNDPPQLRDETTTPTVSRGESTQSPVREIALDTRGPHAFARVIDIDRLYEAVPGTSSQIVRALELLKQVSDFLVEAQKSDNAMDADRFVQRVQLALPRLFAYRSTGDGFGVIINSLHFAFSNLHGTPLTPDQLNVIWRVLRELRARPAMSLEQAIQRVEELEECGLEVDPPNIGDVLEGAESAQDE